MPLRFLALLCAVVWAQPQNPVAFTLRTEAQKAAPGKTLRLALHAEIEKGWHLYSVTSPVVPTATRFAVPEGTPLKIQRVLQKKVEAKFDPAADATTESYEEKAVFYIDAELDAAVKPGPVELALQVRSSACNDRICLPAKRRIVNVSVEADPAALPARLDIPDGFVEANLIKPAAAATPKPQNQKESMASFLIVAFLAGLASILTPCVFPMIPFTLSYFINRTEGGKSQAAVFCLGIIVLFTVIGLTASAFLGASGAQQLSSNVWVNGVISVVFCAFGLSMLGAFEITLPSGMLTKLNDASGGGGYAGALMMGLTFSLTSFACIGPFMGSLLAASVTGDRLQPALGMASFATGLALPFFLLALFPAWLKKLPKSGGWMMRVKVVLAFFVFAMMVKYVSNVDAVLHWEFLTRERFLAAWAILAAMPAFYLLGWFRYEGINHDEDVTIPRLLISCVLLIFSLTLLAGMNGAPLGEIDAYVPAGSKPGAGPAWMKNDLLGALAKAKAENKKVFVNFTGYTCTNCKLMKATMFPRPAVAEELSKFVLVELYTDGADPVSEANMQLQETKVKTAAIPTYVILDTEGNVQRSFEGFTRDEAEYLKFLRG
ncbi:MAG: DUF255 domain-containing protein [Acidobacteria bacterium]|nr:DUF255 domain-containing protein [Acidobacteriota bacterium]